MKEKINTVNKKQAEVLLIIPAYNEQECIERVVMNLIRNYPQFDYIVVNDGSQDSTSEICHRNRFNVIDLPVNLGLTGAFQAGMRYAAQNGYECAIQFDADGQHRPEKIEVLAQKIKEGSDIVIGSRFVENKKPFSPRMIGSRLIEWSILITTGKRVKDPTSGMRMYSKKAIQAFSKDINLTPEPDTISFLLKSGYKVSEVQTEMDDRMAGESYLNFSKSVKYMGLMLTSILLIQPMRSRRAL